MVFLSQPPLWQNVLMSVRLGDWKRGYMAVMAVYVDASGSLSELAVTPAAMVSTPEKWIQFERKWNSCLDVFGVTSLHMKHFAFSRGEYTGWDQDQNKRRRFLNHLMTIIEDHIEYTASEAVYINDYDAFDKIYEFSETARPYTMGCFTAAGHIFEWGRSRDLHRNDFVWLFEKGDIDQHDLRQKWNQAYPDAAVEPIFLKKIDAYPDSNLKKRQRPFEAADLVAYENLKAHKLLDERGDSPVYEEELRKPLQRMVKWPGADKWGFFAKDGMQRWVDASNIKLRKNTK